MAQAPTFLQDVTPESGIQFQHFSGNSGKHFIVETVASGLVSFDFDGDGLLDIYFLNGAPLLNRSADPQPTNHLYRNEGDFRFHDVTQRAGVGDTGFALGGVAGDFDNDGDQDLFISNFGNTVLLENSGDGTFVRREYSAPHERPQVGAGLALLDINRDGLLDLYVANYVQFGFDRDVSREIFGVPAAPGPKDYLPEKDCLYLNLGEGNFLDISAQSGISDVAGTGMGVIAFDFDRDSDTDIFVGNDSAPNFLFENLGESSFAEIGLLAGLAYDVTGAQQATMGVDFGDYNHDGWLDLVTTNFADEVPTLYENSGAGFFDDVGVAAGLGVANRSVTWGVAFVDIDNDSWLDLYIAAGHLISGVSRLNDTERFEAPNLLLLNDGGGKFTNWSHTVKGDRPERVSRSVAVDDFNNDGRVDVAVLNLNDTPQLYANVCNSTPANHFLNLHLVGQLSNRDGVGCEVIVRAGSLQLAQQTCRGRGYQSHFGSRLHFGLGKHATVDSITISWPSGVEQQIGPISGDRFMTIFEPPADAEQSGKDQ
ncbi:MAG: CRTAC1 family protein [Planctomycetales bacterium]|nr:CRTAC1 family protein [Planctomycetales bacterium]